MRKILFIGNSFTYVNDLPAMLQELATEAGEEVLCDAVVKGGAKLSDCFDPEHQQYHNLAAKYPEQTWDTVILQDQSFNPVGDTENFLAAAKRIQAEVLQNGEQVFFYQTWAYKEDTAKLDTIRMGYEEMYLGLKASYTKAAKEMSAGLAPVGDAFALCNSTYPRMALYKSDAFHPSKLGTYLAACVFFGVLFGRSPLELSTPKGIDEREARRARELAQKVLN